MPNYYLNVKYLNVKFPKVNLSINSVLNLRTSVQIL